MIIVDNQESYFKTYKDLSHFDGKVIHGLDDFMNIAEYIIAECESRHLLLTREGMRDIVEYNTTVEKQLQHIVLIIADYADFDGSLRSELLMNLCRKICPIASTVGIHLVLAAAEVPPLLVEDQFLQNFPARISFKTKLPEQSQALLSCDAALYLYYSGDAMFKRGRNYDVIRVQTYE